MPTITCSAKLRPAAQRETVARVVGALCQALYNRFAHLQDLLATEYNDWLNISVYITQQDREAGVNLLRGAMSYRQSGYHPFEADIEPQISVLDDSRSI